MLKEVLAKLLGKGAGQAAEGISSVIDRFVVTKEDKHKMELEMTEILFKAEQVDQENVTNRWKADMSSDNKLSKTIRPLVLAFLTVMVIVIIILDGALDTFVIKHDWVVLLEIILANVYTAYFGGRTIEKFKSMSKSK